MVMVCRHPGFEVLIERQAYRSACRNQDQTQTQNITQPTFEKYGKKFFGGKTAPL